MHEVSVQDIVLLCLEMAIKGVLKDLTYRSGTSLIKRNIGFNG